MKQKIFAMLMFLIPVSLFAAKKDAQSKIPSWAFHKEAVYPSELYITAEGEGETADEAKLSALSGISLYFNTKATTENNLTRKLNEIESEKENIYTEETAITERARIESDAEFFCVEFSEPYTDKKTVHILALIDRDRAYLVYKEKIEQNKRVIRELLAIANDRTNPVRGLKAAKESCEKAGQTGVLIGNAGIVKRLSKNAFLEEEELIEKSYQALKKCNSNMAFDIEVENDWNQTIKNRISKILEARGFSLSQTKSTAPQKVTASITETAQTLESGTFVTLNIHIEAKSTSVENAPAYFSYSRTLEKKGSRTKEDAYRRAYLQLEEELESSFKEELEKFYLGGMIKK